MTLVVLRGALFLGAVVGSWLALLALLAGVVALFNF